MIVIYILSFLLVASLIPVFVVLLMIIRQIIIKLFNFFPSELWL